MSTEFQTNNKRIAKNTIYLYLRMVIMMGVGFYTSRVILQALGISDFGIYNVLGGIIGMLGYVNTVLAGGTSRFITIELGKGNLKSMKDTFSMANSLCLLSVVIILLFGETVGLWFVNSHLNIDECRMVAANWVFQCALVSSCLSVLQTPYTAAIIAHEKMSVYAYMSIYDATMKLLIVFILSVFDFDKLILYAILLLCVNLSNIIIYRLYCNHSIEECTMRLSKDKEKFKQMFSYSGWNTVSTFSMLLINYGVNILINIFFGTVVNAARGIAVQVNNIVQQFYSNFQLASRPQIMKYYAQNNISSMSNLIINSSKYCALLLLCLIIPVSFNIEGLLKLWLGIIPDYTSEFIRLMFIQVLIFAIDVPVGYGIHAVGKMKLPNLTVSLLYLSVFPLTYIAYKNGASPTINYIIFIFVSPLILFADMLILKHYVGFEILPFLKKCILPLVYISAICLIVPSFLYYTISNDGVITTLINTLISTIYVMLVCFFLGLSSPMRKNVLNIIIKKIKWK